MEYKIHDIKIIFMNMPEIKLNGSEIRDIRHEENGKLAVQN